MKAPITSRMKMRVRFDNPPGKETMTKPLPEIQPCPGCHKTTELEIYRCEYWSEYWSTAGKRCRDVQIICNRRKCWRAGPCARTPHTAITGWNRMER